MIFTQTSISGVYTIDIQKHFDQRGFFARTWDKSEFATQGLQDSFLQCSISYNKKKGTLRGMHFQKEPHEEVKIVSVSQGAIYDVVLDLRTDSLTFKQWLALELSSQNKRALYVPKGVAHGFITLTDATEVYYQIDGLYVPDSAKGVRWDDPAFGIVWPMEPVIISKRDKEYLNFTQIPC